MTAQAKEMDDYSMTAHRDRPDSSVFRPVSFEELARHSDASVELAKAVPFAHSGSCVAWGIPFKIGNPVFLRDQAVTVQIPPTTARWLVFLHASYIRPPPPDQNRLFLPCEESCVLPWPRARHRDPSDRRRPRMCHRLRPCHSCTPQVSLWSVVGSARFWPVRLAGAGIAAAGLGLMVGAL